MGTQGGRDGRDHAHCSALDICCNHTRSPAALAVCPPSQILSPPVLAAPPPSQDGSTPRTPFSSWSCAYRMLCPRHSTYRPSASCISLGRRTWRSCCSGCTFSASSPPLASLCFSFSWPSTTSDRRSDIWHPLCLCVCTYVHLCVCTCACASMTLRGHAPACNVVEHQALD